MSKEMKNDYEKALKLYHKGEIKKSLQCCEEGISKNLKNSAVLNLKGLILYLKGDLDGAITVWKINKDFNDDEMSKTYIKDAENDSERQKEYEKARNLIKELHINEAIESLKICSESDFNSIQVNNALALCQFKKGDYKISREYVNKSLKINKHDTNAKAIKKQLDDYTQVESNKNRLIKIAVVFILFISLSAILVYMKKDSRETNSESIVNNTEADAKDKIHENNTENENINSHIDDDNGEEDKKEEESHIEVNITSEEIENNYIKASTYFTDEKYDDAKLCLNKVVKASVGNHLNNDIVFLLASTYEKLDDKNNSIKYFEEYISIDKNGDYIEEVYYKLALLYKDIDIVKSLEYANYLSYNYPKSIYNNSNIESILAN